MYRHLVTLLFAIMGMASSDATAATIHEYKFVAIAPNGQSVASVETAPATHGSTPSHARIVVRGAADGRVLRKIDPCGRCTYSGLAWSPDGTHLAFIATDAKSGRADILVAGPPGRHPDARRGITRLASLHGVAGSPAWSPDGTQLALLMTPDAKKLAGALEAGAPAVGEIGESADEQRIAVLPAGGGTPRFVSPADQYVYEYDWMPDGRGFVATAAHGNGDNNWWIAELESIDLASGAVRAIAHPDYQVTMPRVAPDGRSVVYIGGLMSDFGSAGGDVYRISIDGGEPIDLTPGFRGSFASLAWRAGRLYAAAYVVDRIALLRFDEHLGSPEVLWSAAATVATNDDGAGDVDPVISLSRDGTHAATVTEDFGQPPAILAGTSGAMRPITSENDALAVTLAVRSLHWKSDGLDIQGWLVGPPSPPDGRTLPMIVRVHGGPSWATLPSFGRDDDFEIAAREWVARGYYVFLPNPRGSYGQGEAFTRANVRDFGGGDLRDILAGLDVAQQAAPVDAGRIGLFGHSYGGFMTMWAVTHTQRFKAAIAGAGIANWISYYGQNGIDRWMTPFFGATAYDDPAIYRAASPIESIKAAHTPTMMYVGERDLECPAAQSLEFWHALKSLGVPTQLTIYAGSGHWIHDPEQGRDLRTREIAWFGRLLSP